MSVQQVYIALFGRPADPGGLAYWNQVTNIGADLSVMLKVLPGLPEYTTRFAGMDNTQIVTTIYQNLFGRAPDADGLKFFTNALAGGTQSIATIAVNILQGAQGEDKQDVQNKEQAANLFTASIDTPEELAAYNGANAAAIAKAFLDKVDAQNPATVEQVNQAAGQVQSGQGPNQGGGGGGGGGPTPTIEAATIDADGVISIASGVNATVTDNGASLTVLAAGFIPVTFSKAVVEGFDVASSATIHMAGSVFNQAYSLEGLGTVDLLGVSTTGASTGVLPSANGINVNNVKFVIDTNFQNGVPDQEIPTLTVNGDDGQGIILAWLIQDAQYRADAAAGTQNGKLGTNLLGVEISKQYAEMLQDDPGSALLDFIAKASATRAQTIHDNLLGNASEAAISGSRYGSTAQDPAAQTITAGQVAILKGQQPLEFKDRPYESGDPITKFSAADAWDVQHPDLVSRPDLVAKVSAATFTQEATNVDYEPSIDIKPLLDKFITDHRLDDAEFALLTNLTGGDRADAIRLVWDYVDDLYVAGGVQNGYYSESVNSFGVDLGLQYAEYLLTGGTKITDTVKFTAGARDQKMHDNLLGNMHHISIEDKFNAKAGANELFTAEAIKGRFVGAFDDFAEGTGRPIYSGNVGESNSATVSWDAAYFTNNPI